MDAAKFSQLLRQKGDELYREMPWRQDTRPYYVLVSELMLQQTQVPRVVPKFEAFIARFPDERALAVASLSEVLQFWQGLGYNRRAKFLHDAARMIIDDYNGIFPDTDRELQKLPGVGKNTAGAILAYAFNQPVIFIETNVRTVILHHFFNGEDGVDDADIAQAVERVIDHDDPRHFYQNIMDYGSWLKANGVRNISKSKHYRKQAPLKGSVRELRGEILRQLHDERRAASDIYAHLSGDERFSRAVAGLGRDGLLSPDELLALTK